MQDTNGAKLETVMIVRTCSIAGVSLFELKPNVDERGQFTEIFRESWGTDFPKVQWNCVRSTAGVLRGVHVHVRHHDYLVVVAGKMLLGLHDIRKTSPSFGRSEMIAMTADAPISVAIPPGVCHGFYFSEPSVHVYSVSEYWNPSDELGCRFDSKELGLPWPDMTPKLSDRDAAAGGYGDMLATFESLSASSSDRVDRP